MRNRLLLGAGIVVIGMAVALGAFAGDYHVNKGLICMDCHTMHAEQVHGYGIDSTGAAIGGDGGFFNPIVGGPHERLLRNDINELCLGCHDGKTFAPDVLGANSSVGIDVRQAGALNEPGLAGYAEISGHTLGETGQAPGGAWVDTTEGLNCVSCHSAHGSTNYRNLRASGGAVSSAITYDAGVTKLTSVWVHEDANSGVTSAHYGRGAITFNEPADSTSMYGNFCKGCHPEFHGQIGGIEIEGTFRSSDSTGTRYQGFVRHPAAGVNLLSSRITRLAGKGANQVQLMSPTGKKAGTYAANDYGLTPSCFTCHKGHGNKNAFGLIYMLGSGAIDEEGDNGVDMRNTCRQCHGQGGGTAPYAW